MGSQLYLIVKAAVLEHRLRLSEQISLLKLYQLSISRLVNKLFLLNYEGSYFM